MNKQTELNEIRITVPEGMEIDKENSTFECIKFKKKQIRWIDDVKHLEGYFLADPCFTINPNVHTDGILRYHHDDEIFFGKACLNIEKNVFATEKQAISARAMAQISQIMANDERFGGVVTDEEWRNRNMCKYILYRSRNIIPSYSYGIYRFLAFHTAEQRDLFLKENRDLVKQYLMLD